MMETHTKMHSVGNASLQTCPCLSQTAITPMIYKDGMPPFGLIGCSAAASSLASATILRNLWLERPLEVWLRAPRCPPQPTLFRAGGDWRPASAIGVKLERARRSRGVGARSAGEFLACSCCAIDSLRAFFNACSSVSDGGGTTDRSRNSTSSSRLRCSCSVCASRVSRSYVWSCVRGAG